MSLPRYVPPLIGLAAAIVAFLLPHPITMNGIGIGDIGPPIVGMAQFLHGASPYMVAVRAGRVAAYPFTTMLVLSPFLVVPLRLVATTFCGLVSFALAEAIRRNGAPWQLLLFATPSYVSALHSVQWSPLMTAALLAPALLPFAVVKPQLGIALVAAGRWSWRSAIAAASFVLLSIAIFPRWPWIWLKQGSLNTYLGRPPFLIGPGILLLASAYAWRRWRGRCVLAMSIVPQRFFYDQLLLFVAPTSVWQMALMLATSWTAVVVSLAAGWWIPQSGDQNPLAWIAVVLGFHLPAAAIVVWNERRRPTSVP
ncbi:MAG TPA: hypothetical protein VHU41_04200 [Thermoanaerobaculia bacterium]|nr:hypothetical protein [Thermoanaerobaculia bacterium]